MTEEPKYVDISTPEYSAKGITVFRLQDSQGNPVHGPQTPQEAEYDYASRS